MANPCPCELVDNETPTITTTDSSAHVPTDEDSTDDSIESAVANVQQTDKYQDLTNLYPFVRQTKSLSTTRKRFKRPSWATIGKRSSILIKKRPSWAHIG
jgi:hypothetical protein